MHSQNYQAHILASEGNAKPNVIPIPHIHVAHIKPYTQATLASMTNPTRIIRKLKIFMKKEHNRLIIEKTKQFRCRKMDLQWSNTPKLSNSYWKTQQTTNTQTTQIIKLRSAHYMGNYRKILFCPQKFPNPKYTLRQSNDQDTWPHLLSLCNLKFLKGLRITRHNAATQQITILLKCNTQTRHYTLTNVGNNEECPHDNTIPLWSYKFMPNNQMHLR